MFQRIGFRHALATTQLVFFLVIMIPYEYQAHHPALVNSDDVSWDLKEFSAPEWVRICAVVNAPAAIVFGAVGRLLPERFTELVVGFTAVGVFFQWYLVGLWRDIRAGAMSSARPTKPTPAGIIFAWIGVAAASILGLLAIAAQIFYFEESNSILISFAVWCGFFSAFLLAKIRRRGASASNGSTLAIK